MIRTGTVQRTTQETDITIEITLDGAQTSSISTGIGFFDHMLTLLAKHGRFGLVVEAKGDTYVDAHHTVEDVGLALGQALVKALGDKAGRPYLVFQGEWSTPVLGGNFETELVEDFFQALAMSAAMNLHVLNLYGRNTHHIIESMFKATGRALRKAVTINPDIQGVNSTKGVI